VYRYINPDIKKRTLEILDEGWDVEETEEIVDILAVSLQLNAKP
jgi:hypothetical protein